VDSFRSTLRQEILDRLAAMDGGAIPQKQQFPINVAQQVPQKLHHLSRSVGLLLKEHQQLSVWCNRADRRQMIITERGAQDRRLAPWRIRPYHRWQQVETCLIYPD
jgi:hypothetical protein